MQILKSLLKSTTVDKSLLIKAIKKTGKSHGEQILLELLQQANLNEDVGVFIIKCLSSKGKTNKTIKLNIKTTEFPLSNIFQMNKLYMY